MKGKWLKFTAYALDKRHYTIVYCISFNLKIIYTWVKVTMKIENSLT